MIAKINIKNFICYILINVIISSINLAYAIVPPDIVYRGDTRNVTTIFSEGFSSKGTNIHVIRHVAENSGDSAYISTSSELRIAQFFGAVSAGRYQNTNRSRVFWVYRIRPTGNFHSINESLNYGMQNGRNETSRSFYFNVRNDYGEEQEWAAIRAINAQQIESATLYRANADYDQRNEIERINSYEILGTVRNPNYRDQGQASNSIIPYIMNQLVIDATRLTMSYAGTFEPIGMGSNNLASTNGISCENNQLYKSSKSSNDTCSAFEKKELTESESIKKYKEYLAILVSE
ncbi:hypothetical protein Xmau_03813 [Xenorhabdus mauleonii]|uniref:Pertussis toxin, subunit 1 n=1 Tax=Xenorhabdus mauleonii TaxID=351675 RepID=A0A1I3V2B7_9GAMM|nr:hypothetical protein [Xenorhabdus mauleonii]PHM37596.1 hypothetical protein Xmau_03813 [Xenorhabdus mauleonii]SFJ89280.1 Pertussis toxin, subunit 1 [Xenorhabdus mauleonii]